MTHTPLVASHYSDLFSKLYTFNELLLGQSSCPNVSEAAKMECLLPDLGNKPCHNSWQDPLPIKTPSEGNRSSHVQYLCLDSAPPSTYTFMLENSNLPQTVQIILLVILKALFDKELDTRFLPVGLLLSLQSLKSLHIENNCRTLCT